MPKEARTCAYKECSNTFEVFPSSTKRFCCPSCGTKHTWETRDNTERCKRIAKSNTGKKQTEECVEKRRKSLEGHIVTKETRKKIGIANTGKVRSEGLRKQWSEAKKGDKHWNWQEGKIEIICLYCGKKKEVYKYEKDTAKYCSKDCADADKMSKYTGEKHPNWQGGISRLPYSFEFNKEFKTLVRERDNNTCQLCGKTRKQNGKNLLVHHIYYDKENTCVDMDNFITLCIGCNGKVNFNREYWTKFFDSKLELRTAVVV